MTHAPALRAFGLAGLALIAASPSTAQTQYPGHYYGGFALGRSSAEVDAAGTTAALLPGVSAATSSSDARDSAYRLFGGYQMNRHLALEGGYFNLGTSRFNATTAPAGTLAGSTKVHGVNLDLVGTWPVTERFSALGRVGVQHAWSRSSFSGTGAAAAVPPSVKHDGTHMKVGLGAQYAFSPSMWLRGEVERYRVKNVAGERKNINAVFVSLVFPFGGAPAPRVAAAAPTYLAPAYVAPAYVAPAPAPAPAPVAQVAAPPAPAPVVVAVPVPAPPQRINFSADTLFGFDRADVRPEARGELDRFSQQLRGVSYDTIQVEGHTDRLGSSAYNQTLSGERAASVKDYLVRQGQLDGNKVSATGKGEASPVTQAQDCSDRLGRTALIACLQPDRRVEVEVTGTR